MGNTVLPTVRTMVQLVLPSSFILLPSPSQTFHLHLCLAVSGSSHFRPTCIPSDVIPAGDELRQLLLPSFSLLSGLKTLLSLLLNPSPTTHVHHVWSKMELQNGTYLSFFPCFFKLFILLDFFSRLYENISYKFFVILKKNLLTLPILDVKTLLAF